MGSMSALKTVVRREGADFSGIASLAGRKAQNETGLQGIITIWERNRGIFRLLSIKGESVVRSVLLHRFTQLLQRRRQLLWSAQYAGKQIANAVKSPENVGDMELRRFQSGHNLFPLERRGYRSAGMRTQHIRRGDGFAACILQIVEVDLALFPCGNHAWRCEQIRPLGGDPSRQYFGEGARLGEFIN